jgi:hypothetical protein
MGRHWGPGRAAKAVAGEDPGTSDYACLVARAKICASREEDREGFNVAARCSIQQGKAGLHAQGTVIGN